MKTIRPIRNVPYYAQFEDSDHIADYISGKKDLINDPYWQRSGAKSPEDYAFWANRACGMVCVKTCVEAFGGPILPLHTWIQRGLDCDAYLSEKRRNDTHIEKGWLHAGLAKVMETERLTTKVKAASIAEVVQELQAGRLVIASVSFEVGTEEPITHQGGHLVTVVGANLEGSELVEMILHNPSGRKPQLRENAVIAELRFRQAFSGRVIIVGRPG
ncbi:MAG: C39 family peptidase [Anaerolineae bacterium]|nr:C39 family peptidase [Anaerolineae bacterium]